MEENQNYGIPAQDAGYENSNVESTFVGNEVNTFVSNGETVSSAEFINNNVSDSVVYANPEPVMAQEYVQEAQVVTAVQQEPVVAEAQVNAPVETAVAPQSPAQAQVEEKLIMPEIEEGAVRIVFKTSQLKDALRKADIVASKNELQPVTEVVMFKVEGQNVQVRATDRENILTVIVPTLDATDGTVVTLKLEHIKPLADKLASNVTAFIINGTTVTVVSGKGKYNLIQALDLTTNEVIVVPSIDTDYPIPLNETIETNKDVFMKPIELTLPLVSGVANDSQYATINLGDKVTSTTGDEVGACFENVAGVFGATALLKLSTVKALVSMGVDDKINVGFGNINGTRTVCVYTNGYRLYAILKEGEEEYPIDEINSLLTSPVGAALQVNRAQLLGTLERLTLFFVSTLARQNLDFERTAGSELVITNESKAKERLVVNGNGELATKLDVKRLYVVVKAMPTEDIILEPVIDGDGPISFVKVSSSDRKVVFVIGASL